MFLTKKKNPDDESIMKNDKKGVLLSIALFSGTILLGASLYLILTGSLEEKSAKATFGATYYVDKDSIGGTCSNTSNTGTVTSPFCTLAKAITTASGGDTIILRAGTYPASTIQKVFNSYVTVKAYDNEKVVFNANGQWGALQVKSSKYVRISGMEFTGAKGSYGAGIYVDKGSDIEILNNKVYANNGSTTGGILIEDASNILIKGNETYDNTYSGIKVIQHPTVVSSMVGIQIIENKSYNNLLGAGNADGIGLEGSGISGTLIKNNVAYNNGDDGIDTWTSHSNIVEGNISYNHKNSGDGNGFKMGGTGSPAYGGNNIVRFNVSYDNKANGFTSNGGGNNKYYNNVAYGNTKFGFDDGWRYGCSATTCKTYLINNIGVDNGRGNLVANGETFKSHNNLWYDSATKSAKISYNYSLKDTLLDFYNASGKRLEGASTSLVTNPLFVNLTNKDFRVSACSPAIDYGDATVDLGLTYSGLAPDTGINEYYPALETNCDGTPINPTEPTGPVPTTPVCGNSVKETGEMCDDGNTRDNDQCSADCKNVCTAPAVWNGSTCYTQPTDTMAPSITLKSPSDGATISTAKGGTIKFLAEASDNVGVTKVEFYIGTRLVCTDTTAAYGCSAKPNKSEKGTRTLTAKAYDAKGNISSVTIIVTIK